MSRNLYALVVAATAIGLAASACSSSPNSATNATPSATATQLQSLIPTPANTQRTDGPDSIPDNGIHLPGQRIVDRRSGRLQDRPRR
jgi:hypothetical protein